MLIFYLSKGEAELTDDQEIAIEEKKPFAIRYPKELKSFNKTEDINKYEGLGLNNMRYRLQSGHGDIEIVSYDFFQNIKDNYTFIIYHPLDLKEQLEEALETNTNMSDEVRNRVLTMKNSLNENDNDILVICKFKQ